MKRSRGERDGFAVYTLENDDLSVSVMPALGGKLISLRDQATGFECLFQNPRPPYRVRHHGDSFSDHDASGFDDAFPCVDAGEEQIAGRTVCLPDHGEIWTTPMRPEETPDGLTLSGAGTVLHYDYDKSLSLNGRDLCLRYRIVNREAEPIPCLWTMHCLVNCDEDTRVFLPPEAAAAVNLFPGPLGEPGLMALPSEASFPALPPAGTMYKFYMAEPVSEGVCGFLFPKQGLRLTILFPEDRLPYLGLWSTGGWYRGDKNAALEPSTGYYDSVAQARENRRLPMIASGERFCFELTMRVDRINAQ